MNTQYPPSQYPPPPLQYPSPMSMPMQPLPTDQTILRLKDLEIQTLLREVEMLRGLQKNPKQKIPLSIDLIIRNLKMKNKAQDEEIRRLRESLNSGDPLHVAVYEKLRDVITENKELEKMISAGRVQQLGMEIGLLKRENEQLRHVMEDYKRVLFEMDEDLERCVALVKEYQIRYGELE